MKKLARESPEDPLEVHSHPINALIAEIEDTGLTNARDHEAVVEDTAAPAPPPPVKTERRININHQEEEEEVAPPVPVGPRAADHKGVRKIQADHKKIHMKRKKIEDIKKVLTEKKAPI